MRQSKDRITFVAGNLAAVVAATSALLGLPAEASATDLANPVPVVGVSRLAAGGAHTCGVSQRGMVLCWGNNKTLVEPDSAEIDSVLATAIDGQRFSDIVGAGHAHSCAVAQNGDVFCWGWNYYGQLGTGDRIDRPEPTRVVGLPAPARSLALGVGHTCASLMGGATYCWGLNNRGELGNSTFEDSLTPAISAVGYTVEKVAAGFQHTCALTSEGRVICWGSNDGGQLGDDNTPIGGRSPAPVPVRYLQSGVAFISAGARTSCAVTSGAVPYCWGRVYVNGSSTPIERNVRTVIKAPNENVRRIAHGGSLGCALYANQQVQCWGQWQSGQLGAGNVTIGSLISTESMGGKVLDISTGTNHACALLVSGSVRCWGRNDRGQAGSGSFGDLFVPTQTLSGDLDLLFWNAFEKANSD